VLDAAGTKRQLEREEVLFELEMQERKLAIHRQTSLMGAEVQERNLRVVHDFVGLMTTVDPDWKKDVRFRIQVVDSIKTVLLCPHQPLITNSETQVSLTRSVSISQLAQELGMRFDIVVRSVKSVRECMSRSTVRNPRNTVRFIMDARYLCVRTRSVTVH
jgi:hypothetical protein